MTAAASNCVLIVDDEADIRETLREVVEMGGCRAILAANGADALLELAKGRPCMVILDLLMPVMSGIEMLQAMRKEPELASVPVLISTSAPSRAPAGEAVMGKPIDIHALWKWMRARCACNAAPIA